MSEEEFSAEPARPSRGPGRSSGGTSNGEAAAGGRRRLASFALANGVPLVLLALWWWTSTRVSPLTLPSPQSVARETFDLLVGADAVHTWTSMLRIVISVVLAMAIGALIVFIPTAFPVTEKLIANRVIPFFNSVPALGWAILGVIWFGIGNFAVIVVVAAILIPFCTVNLWEGMRALDPGLREMGRSFTRSRVKIAAAIEFPLLLPYVFAALRLSFSVGWKVALIAEFFGARSGLGLVMNRARQSFDTPTVFATIVVVLLIVTLVDRVVFDPIAQWSARRTGTVA